MNKRKTRKKKEDVKGQHLVIKKKKEKIQESLKLVSLIEIELIHLFTIGHKVYQEILSWEGQRAHKDRNCRKTRSHITGNGFGASFQTSTYEFMYCYASSSFLMVTTPLWVCIFVWLFCETSDLYVFSASWLQLHGMLLIYKPSCYACLVFMLYLENLPVKFMRPNLYQIVSVNLLTSAPVTQERLRSLVSLVCPSSKVGRVYSLQKDDHRGSCYNGWTQENCHSWTLLWFLNSCS